MLAVPSRPLPGAGRKRPQRDIEVEKLHLDGANPRLPEEAQGKPEDRVLEVLYRDFHLDELADSMAQNGYFDEEPLVAIPQNVRKRRLASSRRGPPKAYLNFIAADETEFTVV